jgi:putative membrane protein
MERRLLKAIMNPAMIASFLFGFWMVLLNPDLLSQGWFHVKLAMVFLLAGVHGKFSVMRKAFAEGRASHSDRYYRIWNEAPTVLMIVIVIMVVVQPF